VAPPADATERGFGGRYEAVSLIPRDAVLGHHRVHNHFAPGSTLILPSGKEISGDEAAAFSSLFADNEPTPNRL
jgi:hypothetical protein